MQSDAIAANVLLEVHCESANVLGDENLLTSALTNLVKNAIQASNEGQKVSLNGHKEDLKYVIEIADSGKGISEDLQKQIFEPFFTTREKGTGLGLPLAQKLVEAHRGTLTLKSKPGETIFRVELPLAV